MVSAEVANPFLFLQPYDLKGRYTLEGRTEEAETLLSLLQWKDIIVVFGKSGVGKTSFINFTLSDKINRVSWLPVRITRMLDINKSFCLRMEQAMKEESIDRIHESDFPELDIKTQATPATNGATAKTVAANAVNMVRKLYLHWNRPVYIIIDQLEELFVIGDEREQEIFLETLRQLVDATDVQKKIILVLREEHLGYIQEIERILGGVFQDALAVTEINASDADLVFSSLLTPSKDAHDETSDELREFADKINPYKKEILASCTEKGKLSAQKLQMLLFLLWEKLNDPNQGPIPPDVATVVNDVTDAIDPLRDYVITTVNKRLGQEARLLKARYWFILNNSISLANTKKPVSLTDFYKDLEEDLRKSEESRPAFSSSRAGRRRNAVSKVVRRLDYEVDKQAVRQWCEDLVERRLLEKLPGEDSENGECYYQLKHDILAPAILQFNGSSVPIRLKQSAMQLRFPRRFRMANIDDNPYQGLKQYDYSADDGGNSSGSNIVRSKTNKLYGRTEIIEEYKNFLIDEGNTCLVIVGDSGTGKSSLVKGGLLPALEAEGYSIETKQPGPDLANFQKDIELLIETNKLSGISKHCLYIDQFEECYTYRKVTKEESDQFRRFLDFLSDTIKQCDTEFKLIVSIRHDYAHEFDIKLTDWRPFKKLLRYPNEDEIFDIIVGPAYDKGIHFVPANLPEIIAADAANTSYFLPLLSYTMNTMYETEIIGKKSQILNGEQPCLTLEGYREAGGVVNCLQKQFTRRYEGHADNYLLLQLLPRMIVIKDTIAKSRLLPVSELDFADGPKIKKCVEVLDRFGPDFIRQRNVTINRNTEICYEPLHDSLLTFCKEIRYMINPGAEGDAQTRIQIDMQPRLDLAMQEWLNADEEGKETVVREHYRNLEPLIEFVENPANESKNWLFRKENEFISQCVDFVHKLKNAEKEAQKLRLLQVNYEKKQEELRNQKLQADLNVVTAQSEKKEKELEAKKLYAELKYKKLYQWLAISLLGIVIAAAVAGKFLYENKKTKAENDKIKALVTEKDKLNDSLNVQAQELRLTLESRDATWDSLENAYFEIQKLNDTLVSSRNRQSETIKQLMITRKNLEASMARSESLYDSLMNSVAENERKEKQYDSSLKKSVERNKIYRYNSAAMSNIDKSPALSYRLFETSIAIDDAPHSSLIMRNTLLNEPHYFESLIQDNIHLQRISRDGTTLLTVGGVDNGETEVKIWNTDGAQQGSTINTDGLFVSADISTDNQKILLADQSSIRIYDRRSQTFEPSIAIGTLLLAQFAEDDGRFFAITNNQIIIYPGHNSSPPQYISFDNQGVINSAKLLADRIVVVTPKGVSYTSIDRQKGTKTKKLPQSFTVNEGAQIISMEKPPIGSRNIILFNSKMERIWKVNVPEKAFNLITNFVSSGDGQVAIIQFNQKDYVYQHAQRMQRQQLQVQYSKSKSPANSDDVDNFYTNNLYYVDMATGKMSPITLQDSEGNLGNFILSAAGDSVYETGNGSVVIYSINKTKDGYSLNRIKSVSRDTRFQNIALAGKGRNLLITHDSNKQLKLWRYGTGKELLNKKQIWDIPKEELDRIAKIMPQ